MDACSNSSEQLEDLTLALLHLQTPPQQPPPPPQQQELLQGASSSSAPPPHLENFQLRWEKNVDVANNWNSEVERELSRLEAQLETEKFASFNPYDDGYDSNNSQTWDHPDYN